MKKFTHQLMLLAMMMMVGMTAKAQYTVTIDAEPTDGWVAGQKEFDAAPIVSALGVESFSALKELVDASTLEGGVVYLKVGDEKSNAYTGNPNEWWMNLDGAPQGFYDDGTSWFIGLECVDAGEDEESGETWSDVVNIYVGQMPGVFAKIYEPSSLKATLYLVVDGKEVSFDVTQNVAAAVKANVPDPVTTLSALDIVKDYELKLPLTEGKFHEGKTFETTLEGLYEVLGVEDAASFDGAISDYTFTQVVDGQETAEGSGEYIYTPSDELMLPAEASGGAWFGRYASYDENSGEETPLPMSYPKAWGVTCTFYTQEITLADGKFSIVSGQFDGTMKEGDTDYTYLYIVYGSKAVRVKVSAEVTKPASIPFEEMTKVGEIIVPVKVEKANEGYPTTPFTIDMDLIAEALGVEKSDIDDFYAWAAEGELSGNHTESIGGYYMSEAGYIDTWVNMAPIFVRPVNIANGEFEIGQYAATDFIKNITENTLWKTQLIFRGTDKYYAVNLEATIGLPEASDKIPDDEFGEVVATIPLVYEVKPGGYFGNYSEEELADYILDLNIESIKKLVGEGTYVLYGLKAPANADAQPTVVAAKQNDYSARTASGFDGGCWMASPIESLGEKYENVAFQGAWGDCSYGLEWNLDEGLFGIAQRPDFNDRVLNNSYTSTFYWSLADKSKAIKYLLTVKFVEEPNNSGNNATIIANIDRMVEKSEVENGYDVKAIVAEAFGIDEEEWENVVPKLANSAATYITVEDGSSFVMRNGSIYDLADGEEAPEDCYSVIYEDDAIVLDPMDIPFADGDESKAVIRMAFDYTDAEGATGRVLLNITAVSKDSPLVGVSGINTNVDGKATYYTLQGTPLTAPVKGICIKKQGGKTEVIYVK